jgi:hypothetical protein
MVINCYYNEKVSTHIISIIRIGAYAYPVLLLPQNLVVSTTAAFYQNIGLCTGMMVDVGSQYMILRAS